jgi:glycerate 2-kinase
LTRALSNQFGIPLENTLTILPAGYSPPPSLHVHGNHPHPSGRSRNAALKALDFVGSIPEDGTLICAISGGTSSLLFLPAEGIPGRDKKNVLKKLMDRGAPIEILNAVRTHLSAIKGGGLLRPFRGKIAITVLLSDAPCLSPWVVGSGPSIPVRRNGRKALEILEGWIPQNDIPITVSAVLSSMKEEPPGPPFRHEAPIILGDSSTVLRKAREFFVPEGIDFESLTPCLKGEAREAGHVLASLLLPKVGRGKGPKCYLASGETTVSLGKERGKGGRTFELGLSLGASLGDVPAVVGCLATDGIDGNSGLAGVLFRTTDLKKGIRPSELRTAFFSHDTGGFAEREGFAIRTGPTETNLNDLLWVYFPPSH